METYAVRLTAQQLQLLAAVIDEHSFAGRFAEQVVEIKQALREAVPAAAEAGDEQCLSSPQ